LFRVHRSLDSATGAVSLCGIPDHAVSTAPSTVAIRNAATTMMVVVLAVTIRDAATSVMVVLLAVTIRDAATTVMVVLTVSLCHTPSATAAVTLPTQVLHVSCRLPTSNLSLDSRRRSLELCVTSGAAINHQPVVVVR
jgi:hypothetical protein